MSPRPHAPEYYEFRIDGHLDDHWSVWLDGLTLTHEADGTTTLRGAGIDQAKLHGLLTKLRDLGAILISVEAIDPPDRYGGRPPRLSPSDAADPSPR